jgi:hypothetical protein
MKIPFYGHGHLHNIWEFESYLGPQLFEWSFSDVKDRLEDILTKESIFHGIIFAFSILFNKLMLLSLQFISRTLEILVFRVYLCTFFSSSQWRRMEGQIDK